MIGEPGIDRSRLFISSIRSTVVLHQRREAAADAEVDARARVGGVHPVHVVALAAGHHLERELVVVAQEDRPLAARGDVRRLLHDLDHRVAVLLRDRHVHARHEREVERHVALVAVAEVLAHVLGPLVGLGEQQAVPVVRVERGADLLDDRVRLGQVLVRSCPRARRGTGWRRGGTRRRPCRARSASRGRPPSGPAGCRS